MTKILYGHIAVTMRAVCQSDITTCLMMLGTPLLMNLLMSVTADTVRPNDRCFMLSGLFLYLTRPI